MISMSIRMDTGEVYKMDIESKTEAVEIIYEIEDAINNGIFFNHMMIREDGTEEYIRLDTSHIESFSSFIVEGTE